MNISQRREAGLRKQLAVVEHFNEGGKVKWRKHGGAEWAVTDLLGGALAFDFARNQYEIVVGPPKPEEFFIAVYGDAKKAVYDPDEGDDVYVGGLYDSAEAALGALGCCGRRVFKVVEVLPE